MITQDNIEIKPGMTLFAYKYKQKVKSHTVTHIGEWGELYLDYKRTSKRDYKLYAHQENAEKQRNIDIQEQPWIKNGKLNIRCGKTLANYLAHTTNLPKQNIDVHATKNYIYVCWAKNGLHKTKLDYGFYNLKQNNLDDLVKTINDFHKDGEI